MISNADPVEAMIRSTVSSHPTLSIEQAKAIVLLDVFKQLHGSNRQVHQFGRSQRALPQPLIENLIYSGKDNTMSFVGKKPIWKSKTIIGIAGAAVSIFLPQFAPVVDVLMPEAPALTAESVETTRQAVETIVTSSSNILAAISLLFAGYGRKVATANL